MSNNVLVLAPHTDDGEWGAGGTIAKLIEEGKNVYYVAFSKCHQSLPNGLPEDTLEHECRAANKTMGTTDTIFFDYDVRYFNYRRQEILEDMVKLKKEINPYLVLIPCSKDFHQDHNTIYQEGVRAFKGVNILGYELIWNTISTQTTFFTRLEERHLKVKTDAIMCYHSQEFRNYHNEAFIRSLAVTRGIQISAPLAEAFELIRWIY